MTTLLSRRPWRRISPVSLYWRRRTRMTAFRAAPLRIVERRTSPVTRLSVHQHFHHASHSRLVFSPAALTTVFSTTPVGASHPGVTNRILVKRLLEARPLDATSAAPSRILPTAATTGLRPAPGSGDRPIAAGASSERGRPARRSTRRHRIQIVETERLTHRLTTGRAQHETTRVSRTMQVRETRWRQGTDVVSLEWRKASPSPSADSALAPAPARSTAPPVPGHTPAEAARSTPAPITASPRREHPLPALTMDRSTLDRLADNVMQRIERRVRIERERRGL
jgi:hypothetical protein